MSSDIRASGVLNEKDAETIDGGLSRPEGQIAKPRKYELVWRNIILMTLLHIQALYGVYLTFTGRAKWQTVVFAYFLYIVGGLGITAGVHRLWSHRAYKAKWPLRLLLMLFNTIAFQDCIIHWTRDHRVHHKYFDTDADPHNSTRGFFYSHIGWLLCRKHPDVKEAGKRVDISDLKADPILRFQRDYYGFLISTFCFVLPTIIPPFFWNDSFSNSWFIATCFRYTLTLNFTWCVNSVAHIWGNKPYDLSITPSQNIFVAITALGEGWHNYHHVFPWDYKTAELGNYRLNFTTAFLDLMSKIGWAYDLKTTKILWPMVSAAIYIHCGFIYGMYLMMRAKFYTMVWFAFLVCASIIGVTAGSHRLFSHRSYKVKTPMKYFILLLSSISGQGSSYYWARMHRVHHKFSETDRDPHDIRRGRFFSHIGWICLAHRPECERELKSIDVSDLRADKAVMFQNRHFFKSFLLFVILIPTLVPYLLWNESLWLAYWTCAAARYCVNLNNAFTINSIGHSVGKRPYDKNISPTDNIFMMIQTLGDGNHNFHHVFPFDYNSSEWKGLETYKRFNFVSLFIDFFALFGWVYDRKVVSSQMIASRVKKSGDGSHWDFKNEISNNENF